MKIFNQSKKENSRKEKTQLKKNYNFDDSLDQSIIYNYINKWLTKFECVKHKKAKNLNA